MHTTPRGALASDLLASVVVFLVALPLCMGIAIASGVPPAAGLVTGIVGGIVVGALSGAPLGVSGPAAGLAVIVWDLVQRHGLAAFGVIVLLAGLIQIAAALLGAGRWFRAVPPSVIHGMLAGIGVLIFASQFHVMVDDRPQASGLLNVLTLPRAIMKGLTPSPDLPHEEAALVGLVTILAILAWNRAPRRLRIIPAPLVGVVLATLLANLFHLPIAHVAVPASLGGALRPVSVEALSALAGGPIWLAALAVALVASAETLLCAGAVDRMHRGPRTRYDRELLSQGIGNAICGAVGALPMTAVIVRSSANVQAGARTRASTILHGLWMLLLVALAPGLLTLIPVASLAGVLVYTGYKLVNVAAVRELRRYGWSEVAIYGATVVLIVTTDLLRGVLFGLLLAIVKLLYRMSHVEIVLEDRPGDGRAILHLRGAATFLRLPRLAETLERIPDGREIHVRIEHLRQLDHATLELLSTWEQRHRDRGGAVVIDWDALDRRYAGLRSSPRLSALADSPGGDGSPTPARDP